MTVTAPGPVAATAALAKLSLPLPQTATALPGAARPPDQVDLAPPPTKSALWQLAFSGSQHLDALLPTLERMLQPGIEPMPFAVGHLAQAVGDAAHQIDAGSADLAARNDLARPSPEALEGWRETARAALHNASNLLTQAEHRVFPLTADQNPEALWALTQVATAQRHVGATIGNLRFSRRSKPTVPPPRPRGGASPLSAASALFGILIMLVAYAVAEGLWVAATGLTALVVSGTWLWRVVVSARNFRIELETKD